MVRSTYLNCHESPNTVNSFLLIAATAWFRRSPGNAPRKFCERRCCASSPARILQASRSPSRYRAGAGGSVSSLLARFLRPQRIDALPRDGCVAAPSRRRKGVSVFRTVASRLIIREGPGSFLRKVETHQIGFHFSSRPGGRT